MEPGRPRKKGHDSKHIIEEPVQLNRSRKLQRNTKQFPKRNQRAQRDSERAPRAAGAPRIPRKIENSSQKLKKGQGKIAKGTPKVPTCILPYKTTHQQGHRRAQDPPGHVKASSQVGVLSRPDARFRKVTKSRFQNMPFCRDRTSTTNNARLGLNGLPAQNGHF